MATRKTNPTAPTAPTEPTAPTAPTAPTFTPSWVKSDFDPRFVAALNAAAIDANIPAIKGAGLKSARVDAAIVVRRAYGDKGAVWVYELPVHDSRIVPADFFGNNPATRPDLYAEPTKAQLESGATYNAKDKNGRIVARVKADKQGNPVAKKMSLGKYFNDYVSDTLKSAIYNHLHQTDPARWANEEFVSRRWTVRLEYDVFVG